MGIFQKTSKCFFTGDLIINHRKSNKHILVIIDGIYTKGTVQIPLKGFG